MYVASYRTKLTLKNCYRLTCKIIYSVRLIQVDKLKSVELFFF